MWAENDMVNGKIITQACNLSLVNLWRLNVLTDVSWNWHVSRKIITETCELSIANLRNSNVLIDVG